MSFNCGDVIMNDYPLVHTLMEREKGFRCDYCFKLENRLLRCGKCKSMYYCNKKCQRSDWVESHRQECPILSSFSHIVDKDCHRFLLRLWLRISCEQSLQSLKHKLYNGFERSFNDLVAHEERILQDSKRMQCFHEICNRFKCCDLEFDYSLLLQLFCKICINSFSILNEDLNEIGSGLYICGSVLNHSCEPNAAPIFIGCDLEIRAVKQINTNEEVVINYIDLKNDRGQRRERLLEQYYFDCNCSKCSTHSDKHIDYSLVKNLDKQMDEMITNQSDWLKGYQMGRDSILLYRQIYGHFHPDLTVQLMRVLKLKLLINEKQNIEEETKHLIRKTEQAINITHGFNSGIFRIFRDALKL